jgi:hypothetical protein
MAHSFWPSAWPSSLGVAAAVAQARRGDGERVGQVEAERGSHERRRGGQGLGGGGGPG